MSLKNRRGQTRTDEELGHIKGSGVIALAAEFEGTFIEDSRSDGTMASSKFTPEAAEEENRVFGRDPLRRFVDVEDLPAIGQLAGQRWANYARNAC